VYGGEYCAAGRSVANGARLVIADSYTGLVAALGRMIQVIGHQALPGH
jgi:hypothetical protein